MPRKQPAVPVTEPDPDELEERATDRGDLEDRLGDPEYANSTWTLYRLFAADVKLPAGAKASEGALVLKWTGQFTYDFVREQVGGGVFKVYGRRQGERSSHTIDTFALEGEPKLPSGEYVGVPGTSSAPTTPIFHPVGAKSLGTQEENFVQELRSELRELREQLRRERPQETNLDALAKILTVLRPTQPTVAELMQAMEAGRQASGGGGSLGELLEVLDRLEQRAARAAGNGDSWTTVIRETLPQVLDAFRGARGGRPAPNAPQRTAPIAAPAAAPAATTSATRAEESVPELVRLLVRAMQLNRDPEEVAESAETFLEEITIAQMRGATDALVLQQLKPWMIEVRDEQEIAIYPDLPWERVQRFVVAFLAALRAEEPAAS